MSGNTPTPSLGTPETPAPAPASAPAPLSSAPQEKNEKDKEKETKELITKFTQGISGDLMKGMEAYGSLMIALEKMGAYDIIDAMQKGFTSWQIEKELKKYLEGKLITAPEVAELQTDEKQMTHALPGEKDGEYILRCLHLKEKYAAIPPRDDKKPHDATKVSLMWLKLSNVSCAQAYNSIKDKLLPQKETNKPILYENDLVYMQLDADKYIAGFVKDFDIENEEITLSTVENGAVVHKVFPLKQAFMAFHLAKNTKIMKKSMPETEDKTGTGQQKPADKPAAAPAPTPTAAPGTAPATTPPGTPPSAPAAPAAAPKTAPAASKPAAPADPRDIPPAGTR